MGVLTYHLFKINLDVFHNTNDQYYTEKVKTETCCNELETNTTKISRTPFFKPIKVRVDNEIWQYSVALILITILFVSVKTLMILVYNGSYVDEYFHIFSGISFFETGKFAQFYIFQEEYLRGEYVSFLVGLYMKVFGKTIFAAKLLPMSVGIVNYFLLYYIAEKIIPRKEFVLLLLLVYTTNPWILFNHFYIRMYVFYEMFLLLSLFLFYKLTSELKINNVFMAIFYFILMIALNWINYFYSNDSGKYLILLVNGLIFLYVFLFEIHKLELENKSGLFQLINKCIHIDTRKKLLIVFIALIFFSIIFDIQEKINFLINGDLLYTSSEDNKYNTFFFIKNLVFVPFFFLSLISSLFMKDSYQKMVHFIGGILFTIHISSSLDLQIIRGVVYFLPLFYLISIYSASKAIYLFNNTYFKKRFFICISLLMLLSNFANYPADFFEKPGVPSEVHYIDYANTYACINEYFEDYLIIESSPFPHISYLYNVSPDFVLITQTETLKQESYYFDENDLTYKTIYRNIPVITDLSKIKNSNEKICIIVREPSKDQYIDQKTYNYLRNQYSYKMYKNMLIFFN